jgi:hypothetical protein
VVGLSAEILRHPSDGLRMTALFTLRFARFLDGIAYRAGKSDTPWRSWFRQLAAMAWVRRGFTATWALRIAGSYDFDGLVGATAGKLIRQCLASSNTTKYSPPYRILVMYARNSSWKSSLEIPASR